ncbi:MAG: hypothetical protein H5T91_09085 [Synergistetes bacterium]|nr:hypothetical protein [Synergistota bacterium]
MGRGRNKEKDIFALDIGTRNVVGLIVEPVDEEDLLRVKHLVFEEHKTRSMLDGQIHDVAQVAKVVSRIKENLEREYGTKLSDVSVALAGRALKTRRGVAEIPLDISEDIEEELVRELELQALQNALKTLREESDSDEEFHCVGYSVVKYILDGDIIRNLVGQRGRKAGVEVLATFLPRVVLDSMLSVLRRAGLKLSSITLEPIAAIEVVVLPDMRMLNLALVDVGAGTMDIAITKGGSVVAYGMVPVAGDEITERLCEKFLLDFNVAERVKRSLSEDIAVLEFEDILGNVYRIEREELIKVIEPEVERHAKLLSEKILELNSSPPQAVICVGGGSKVPLFDVKLSEFLGIERNRVRVRGVEFLKGVEDLTGKLKGPEMVTPLGIALVAKKGGGFKFIDVWVNDEMIRLVSLTGELKVLDALIPMGITQEELRPRPGMALTIEVNGEIKIIRGELGEPAKITVNGEEVNIDFPIKHGDRITVRRARPGKAAFASVKDVVGELSPIRLFINGKMHEFFPEVFVDGKKLPLKAPLYDRAKVEVVQVKTVREALKRVGALPFPYEIKVLINGEEKVLPLWDGRILVNGSLASLDAPIKDGDRIDLFDLKEVSYRVKDVLPNVELRKMKVYVNGRLLEITWGGFNISLDGRSASLDDLLYDGAKLEIRENYSEYPILSHVFKYYPIEEVLKGKKGYVKMRVNGEEAGFTTPIKDGDRIEIFVE